MKTPVRWTLIVGGVLAVSLAAAWIGGIRLNMTESYPLGIYRMTNEPIGKGSLVIFCPADNEVFRQARERGYIGAGFCPGGYGYMIKKILAAENDKVEISAVGVSVNGTLLPNSQPMKQDTAGKPLPHIRLKTTLNAHSVLLMSDYNPKSFDARYFGLMDKGNIISALRPVWTWRALQQQRSIHRVNLRR